MEMLCRSFGDPWKSMTVPLAGSNRTGTISVQVKGTPIVATGGPGGFFLSIFSTGISWFWQLCLSVLVEQLTYQSLLLCDASHDMFPVYTTLSKMTSNPRGGPKKLMLEVSGLAAV